MAIFRAMRVGGLALFSTGVVVVTPPVEPPVVVERRWFRPMRMAGGEALFNNGVVERSFSETLTASVRFSYEGDNALVYQDQLTAIAGFRYATESSFELNEVLEALIAFSYDVEVRADVSDNLAAQMQFDFSTRGRLRGWNDDPGPKAVDWQPDPKPNIF